MIDSGGPGGAETVLSALVSRLDTRRFSSLAILPSDSGWLAQQIPSPRLRIATPSAGGRFGPIDVAYLAILRRHLTVERPHLVHAHSFDTTFYASLAVRGTASRLISTFHGASDVRRLGWRNRLKWFAMSRAQAVVCVSRSLAIIAGDMPAIPTRKLRVIHNGIDLTRFSPSPSADLRRRLALDASTALLGAVGNVRAPKGYDVLLQAIFILRTRGVDIHLAIAGERSVAAAPISPPG